MRCGMIGWRGRGRSSYRRLVIGRFGSIWRARGAGKTRSGVEWIRGINRNPVLSRVALVVLRRLIVGDVIVEGESGILAICRIGIGRFMNQQASLDVARNGQICNDVHVEEPDRLRGPQHGAALCDEFAAWNNVQDTWDMLQFGMRLGKKPRIMITTTPRPIRILKELDRARGRRCCYSQAAGQATTPRICRRRFLLKSLRSDMRGHV